MNQHGYIGIRKRTDYAGRRKPYYARISIRTDQFKYSCNFATAEEAATAFEQMKLEKRNSRVNPPRPRDLK